MRMYTQDTVQQALGFMQSQTSYIEPQVVRMRYPELNYADLVPIDGSANEWAKSVTYYSIDMVGQADWFHHQANDIPLADIMRDKREMGIEMAGIGYRYTLEELGQAMMVPGLNLTTERAAAARRAYEEFCHNTALYGALNKGWTGLLNSTAPAVVTLAATWAAAVLANTPNVILQNFNAAISGMWQDSMTIEMADTVLMPLNAMTLLAMTQLPNTTMNLLEWINRNNLYTQETGRQIMIRGVRGLDTAGASGNARMVVYRRDPEVVKMHRPMSHRFLPVWQRGPLLFDVPGIFRLAGVEIRRPGAVRYIDGV